MANWMPSRLLPRALPWLRSRLGAKILAWHWQGIRREKGSPVPVPCIIHMKLGHFATVVAKENGYFRVKNYLGGADLSLTQEVLDEEAGSLALIPKNGKVVGVWNEAGREETLGGERTGATPGGPDPRDPVDDAPHTCGFGMPVYHLVPSQAGIKIEDIPLWYTPPIGPAVSFHLTYNNNDPIKLITSVYTGLDPVGYPFAFSLVGMSGLGWNSDWFSLSLMIHRHLD